MGICLLESGQFITCLLPISYTTDARLATTNSSRLRPKSRPLSVERNSCQFGSALGSRPPAASGCKFAFLGMFLARRASAAIPQCMAAFLSCCLQDTAGPVPRFPSACMFPRHLVGFPVKVGAARRRRRQRKWPAKAVDFLSTALRHASNRPAAERCGLRVAFSVVSWRLVLQGHRSALQQTAGLSARRHLDIRCDGNQAQEYHGNQTQRGVLASVH